MLNENCCNQNRPGSQYCQGQELDDCGFSVLQRSILHRPKTEESPAISRDEPNKILDRGSGPVLYSGRSKNGQPRREREGTWGGALSDTLGTFVGL